MPQHVDKRHPLLVQPSMTFGRSGIGIEMAPKAYLSNVHDSYVAGTDYQDLLERYEKLERKFEKLKTRHRVVGQTAMLVPKNTSSESSVDVPVLRMHLACTAFEQLGKDNFSVSAVLDIDHPESLTNFSTFQDILLSAYRSGYAAGARNSNVTKVTPG